MARIKLSDTTLNYDLVTSEVFLSGNVRRKLAKLERAAAIDDRFIAGVKALQENQPPDIPLEKVKIQPGGWWIPLTVYEAFCNEVFDCKATIARSELISGWEVFASQDDSFDNTQKYGLSWPDYTRGGNQTIRTLTGVELFEKTLNGKHPRINTRKSRIDNPTFCPKTTALARQKQSLINIKFAEWCLRNQERFNLKWLYNFQCNSIVLPKYDGNNLSLSNMSPHWAEQVAARQYQRDAIYRGVAGQILEDELCGYGLYFAVGLGKTICGAAIAAERILNQTAQKVIIVVKRQTLNDVAATIRGAYPQIRLLAATDKDLSIHKRSLFLARVAYNDAQIVVVSHEQFASMTVSLEATEAYIETQIEDIEAAIKKCERDHGGAYDLGLVKLLAGRRERWRRKIQQLHKDHQICPIGFEELGFDFIIVDESDVYKNAFFYTKMHQIKGLTTTESSRADDYKIKRWLLERQHGPGRVVKMTGTPISNMIAELWLELMDLCPNQMRARGWHIFDAWVSVCAQISSGAAIKNTGNIDYETRLSNYVNLPELLKLFRSVAEIQTPESVDVDLKIPKPKYYNVIAPMSDDQFELMRDLAERAREIKGRMPRQFVKRDKKGNIIFKKDRPATFDDNNLFVTTDGRKGCLDYRLINPKGADFHKSKVNMCIRRVFKIWQKTHDAKSVQIIFCDMGVNPKDGFCLYHDIRDKFIYDYGVPADQIAIAQEWSTDAQRDELHGMIRKGQKRIVLASTNCLGVGCNVQNLLIAMHHLDIAWRPRDLEQRIGRILRHGNINKSVAIYRYITQGVNGNTGFDAYIWGIVKNKLEFIRQLFNDDYSIREMSEDTSEDPVFSTAEIVALATGDERIMAYFTLTTALTLNQNLKDSYQDEVDQMLGRGGVVNFKSCIPYLESKIEEFSGKMRLVDELRKAALDSISSPDGVTFSIDGVEYDDANAAGTRLWELAEGIAQEFHQARQEQRFYETPYVGQVGLFRLGLKPRPNGDRILFEIKLHSIDGNHLLETNMLKNPVSCIERILERIERASQIPNKHQAAIDQAYEDIEVAQQSINELQGKIQRLEQAIEQQLKTKAQLEIELDMKPEDSQAEEICYKD